MEIALWIVQGLLGLAFLMTGGMKLMQPKEKLQENMAWVEDFDANVVKGIGVLEILGALGITLPILLSIAEYLTPLAAAGLVIVTIGAIVTHLRRSETQMVVPPLVLGLLATFVLWQYFELLPF